MIVIADAGPLLHLFWVNALSWALPPQPILVVETVWQEVSRYAPEALNDSRLQRVVPSSAVPPVLEGRRLDSGEEAALTYALTLQEEAEVLILCDELRARRVCRDLSLTVKGSVGLILEAAQNRRVSTETARTALRDLPVRGRFYVSAGVLSQGLAALASLEKAESAKGNNHD